MMILVTGGTGTTGGELVRLLHGIDAGFRVMVRNPEKGRELEERGIGTVPGDLTDPESLSQAMGGVDALFLLSPAVENQAQLQINAVNAAIGAGVRYIVKVSALGAALDSPLTLGRAHAEVEQALAESGIEHTILRPGSFMQNVLKSADPIRERGEFYGSSGSGRDSLIDARDIASVAFTALTSEGHAGKLYTLAGPEALSNEDVARILTDTLGKSVRYVDLPGQAYRGGLVEAGLPEWLADDLVAIDGFVAQGHGAEPNGEVETLTGRPARTFGTFATEYAVALR
jgi:uncharacterized protein YbjT (DUF2867 family)